MSARLARTIIQLPTAVAQTSSRRALSVTARKAFTAPTKTLLNKEQDDKNRQQVEPKLAVVDETLTFEHPKVRGGVY